MILDAFDRSRYNVIPVDVHGLHWTCKGAGDRKVEVDKTDFSVPVGDGKIRFDYAFIMIHGTPGEDGKLQGYLEMMGIPYSTSGLSPRWRRSTRHSANASCQKSTVCVLPAKSYCAGATGWMPMR